MKATSITSLFFSLLLLGVPPALAQESDVAGSHDHAMISRFQGSTIVFYSEKVFDQFILPLGPLKQSNQGFSKTQQLEGKHTSLRYLVPVGHAAFEVFRSYQQALASAGFKTLFACGPGNQCGGCCGYFLANLYPALSAPDRVAWDSDSTFRYLAAQLSRPAGEVYVSLYVFESDKDVTWLQPRIQKGQPVIHLDVIETKQMTAGLVTVNAEAMAKSIAAEGRVSLYGIYFDTDKADVKPESDGTLQEIAKLLKATPALKLLIVGHTDIVGTLAYNMDLSRRRADAVVEALSKRFGADSKRLVPVGVGFAAPVASNRTEEGRAKNRRVELVEF